MQHSLNDIANQVFNVTETTFDQLAVKVFLQQYQHNEIYREFCRLMHVIPETIKTPDQIPFLPIQFFKTKDITTGSGNAAVIFESSGTTGSINSRHIVQDIGLYEKSFRLAFQHFYGDPSSLCVLGLLPSYLERGNSSLVFMVDDLVKSSRNPNSGFYLYDHEKLQQALLQNEAQGIPTLLIGVTYALLDFAAAHPMQLKHTIVMETGGMKGRREELTRAEVHQQLQQQLGLTTIHSEYGMTELLSQAYSKENGIFNSTSWMKIMVRAEDDPLHLYDARNLAAPQTGAINIIDLANIHSCAFIATDDMGKLNPDGSFEVMGRLDNSDIRGCGLMLL